MNSCTVIKQQGRCFHQVSACGDSAGVVAAGVGLLPEPDHLHPPERQHASWVGTQLAAASLQGGAAQGRPHAGRLRRCHQGDSDHHPQQTGKKLSLESTGYY